MDDFLEIANIADIPPGRARAFDAGDRKIAVYHTANGFYASDNSCPHRGGPLGEGDVIGNEIVCPWHLWGFDVQTGVCLAVPSLRIQTHEVQIEGERVLVRLTPVPATTESL